MLFEELFKQGKLTYLINGKEVDKATYFEKVNSFSNKKYVKNDCTDGEVKASEKQVGGSHYKQFVIQPAEFCYKNNIPYLEATAIKYLCRWRNKGGVQDLDKAIHFIELIKEYEFHDDNK